MITSVALRGTEGWLSLQQPYSNELGGGCGPSMVAQEFIESCRQFHVTIGVMLGTGVAQDAMSEHDNSGMPCLGHNGDCTSRTGWPEKYSVAGKVFRGGHWRL